MTRTPVHTMIAVTSDRMGSGSEELGRKLMPKFMRQLTTLDTKPDVVAFYNAGVRLLTTGSSSLEALRALEHAGVELIACGTCVDFFKVRDALAAGRVTDMREIVLAMDTAHKVITV